MRSRLERVRYATRNLHISFLTDSLVASVDSKCGVKGRTQTMTVLSMEWINSAGTVMSQSAPRASAHAAQPLTDARTLEPIRIGQVFSVAAPFCWLPIREVRRRYRRRFGIEN